MNGCICTSLHIKIIFGGGGGAVKMGKRELIGHIFWK